jgi:hypothetical protein
MLGPRLSNVTTQFPLERTVMPQCARRMPITLLDQDVETIRNCSVCDGPIEPARSRQQWVSLRVATDVVPLLVNACSTACVQTVPSPPDGYIATPHQGGRQIQQPEAKPVKHPLRAGPVSRLENHDLLRRQIVMAVLPRACPDSSWRIAAGTSANG